MRRAGARGLSLVGLLFAGVVLGQGPAEPSTEGWRTFEGTWSVSGHRQTISTEGNRTAATVQVSGAVVLTSGEGLSSGFRGEALGFDNGAGLALGRFVWTDERGDRIFGELEGEPMETGRRVVGTITGGTGRYAGLGGDFSLVWQYVVRPESDAIQGRATSLRGRVRKGGDRP